MKDSGIVPVLKPMPRDGVHHDVPDGAYFSVRGDDAQIVLVGPAYFSPGDYQDALNDLLGQDFEIERNSFLDPPEARELVKPSLRRGFVAIWLRKE
jgi:hypothetical protein